VVEPNIVRATAARDTGRDALRTAPQEARPETRPAPVLETNGGSWPLQPSVEPPLAAPVQPQQPRVVRDYRPPVTDEPWVPPEPQIREPAREPASRARPSENISGSITGMAAEFNARLNQESEIPPPRPPQMSAPAREPAAAVPPPAPPAPPLPAQTDRNLAEMAQRLEAALRRPNTKDDVHPPATDPLAAPLKAERTEPKLDFAPEVKAEPKFETTTEPKADVKPEAKADAKSKNPFDSLEEEMASLLGRQPGKT
jgi:hypothetical protein